MKEVKKNKCYHLVFDTKKNGPMPIDISIFDSNFVGELSIESIDLFTMKYTNDEFLRVVKESNVLPEEYLFGEIYIIDNFKRRFPVILKDGFNNFDLVSFLIQNIDNKIIMNKLYNKFSAIVKGDEIKINSLKKALEYSDIKGVYNLIILLNYLDQRNLLVYMVDKMFVKERKKEKNINSF